MIMGPPKHGFVAVPWRAAVLKLYDEAVATGAGSADLAVLSEGREATKQRIAELETMRMVH